MLVKTRKILEKYQLKICMRKDAWEKLLKKNGELFITLNEMHFRS